jgi:glycosyltransferase involved in cell wall biosynthesis
MFNIRSGYYNIFTLLKLILFDSWLFLKLVFSRQDYIHAIDLDTGIIGFLVAKLKGKPFIYHCLDPYYLNLPGKWPAFLAKIASGVENHLITNSDLFVITDSCRLQQHVGVRPTEVVEFANVPHDLPEPRAKREDSFVVGYLGSLVEGRNLMTLIHAVGELEAHGVALVIGGFGPLEVRIRNESAKFSNISYVGWVPYDEVLNLQSGFDVIIHTTDPKNASQKWVSPNKLFESMALGIPIIVSNGTLSATRVDEVGCGLTIEYGSKEGLKNAILALANDRAFYKGLVERGKREHFDRWRWDVVRERLLASYKKVR